jgi:hypothetical protein
MMDLSTTRRARAALAGALAAAAVCGATAAQADAHRGGHDAPTAEACAARLAQLETRFRAIEAHAGYDAATRWWQHAWARYHRVCVLGA